MTYCVGMLLEDGLVMVGDTRISAGPDEMSTCRKVYRHVGSGDRVVMLAYSGNVSAFQAINRLVSQGLPMVGSEERVTLSTCQDMFEVASLVAQALQVVRTRMTAAMEWGRFDFDVHVLVAGQVRGSAHALYLVYPAGNFVEANADAPFVQIGEQKFGRSILLRAVRHTSDVFDALKLGLVSMADAIESNSEVGLPIDILAYRRDTFMFDVDHRIEGGDGYFQEMKERWSAALRAAHRAIPRPPYGNPGQ